MRVYPGVLLGAIVLFLFFNIYSFDDKTSFTIGTVTLSEGLSCDDNQQSQCDIAYGSSIMHQRSGGFARLLTPAEERLYVQQQAALAYAFEKEYGISIQTFDQLMNCQWSQIVHKLLQTGLDDVKLLNLWQKYKKKRVWDFGWKQESERLLKEELQRRKERKIHQAQEQEKRVRVEQEQRRCKQLYYQVLAENLDKRSRYVDDRQLALQATVNDDSRQHEKSYEIAADVQALGVNPQKFQKLSGTIFQHQLFKEIADCYKKSAKIIFEHHIKGTMFVPAVLEFAERSFEAVGCQQLAVAMQLNDLCDCLAETSLSICKGVVSSAADFIDCYMLHPQQTVQELVHMFTAVTRTLGGALAVCDTDAVHAGQNMKAMQDQFQLDIANFNTMSELCRQSYQDWVNSSSNQEKVEATSKVVSDLILHPMLAGKLMKSCWTVLRSGSQLAAPLDEALTALQETAGGMTELLQPVTQEELFATTVSDVNTSLFQLVEAEADTIFTIKTPFKIWPVEKMVQGIKKYKNKIPSHETELLANVQFFLEKQLLKANKKIAPKVRNNYKNFEAVIKGEIVSIELDIDHIINAGYHVKDVKNTNYYKVVSYNGGHLAGTVKELEKIGLVFIKEERMMPHGCKHYVVEDLLTGRVVEKTEFPKSWGADKIMKKTTEVFDSAYKVKPGIKKNRIMLSGKTNEGIKIQLILDEIENGYKLVTAIPY